MATTAKTKAERTAERKHRDDHSSSSGHKAEPSSMTAIKLLKQDHREVESYFEEYEELDDEKKKAALARKICAALTVHAQIEEEIFYPQAREATEDEALLDEAVVEHGSAKHLIAEIEAMKPGDDLYDAKIKVLGEQIKQHVKEEEEELFPEVKKAKMDLKAVGEELAARKEELMAESASDDGARRRAR